MMSNKLYYVKLVYLFFQTTTKEYIHMIFSWLHDYAKISNKIINKDANK